MTTAPDIFLSYNREDSDTARRFAEGLEREGFSVWWDQTLRSGEAYDEVTEAALKSAKAVVVLWSPRSVVSRWVRAEATIADRNKTLVPVMIEPCERPIMFELTQTAELGHWRGEAGDPSWKAFVADLRHFIAKDSAPRIAPLVPPSKLAGAASLPKLRMLAALLALAVAMAAGGWFWWGRPSEPQTHRIAFFGFTADPNDSVASAMAKSATDETFATLNALGRETVSRAEALNVEPSAQRGLSKALGATYAMSGEVRSVGGEIVISMRIDDVLEKRTFWEGSITGEKETEISLPVQSASLLTGIVSCYIKFRKDVNQENAKILGAISKVCATVADGYEDFLPRLRELAALVPESATIQANLAANFVGELAAAPNKREARAEVDAALARSLKSDPNEGSALMTIADLIVIDGGSLASAGEQYSKSQKAAPNESFTNSGYGGFLTNVGRQREALPYQYAATRASPLNSGFAVRYAATLAISGRGLEAARLLTMSDDRFGTELTWSYRALVAAFFGAGDLQAATRHHPRAVSDDFAGCVRDFAAIASSAQETGSTSKYSRVSQCIADDLLWPQVLMSYSSARGDLDAAFVTATNNLLRTDVGNSIWIQWLYSAQARPMRADPRFVQLTKKMGLYDYWVTTKTRPDVCDVPEERAFPLCVALRNVQGGRG